MTLVLTESFDGSGAGVIDLEYLDAKHGKFITGLSGRQGGCARGAGASGATAVTGRHGQALQLFAQSVTQQGSLTTIFDPAEEDDVVIFGFAMLGGFSSNVSDGIYIGEYRNVSGVATRIDHVRFHPNVIAATSGLMDVKNATVTTVGSFQGALSNLWKYIEIKIKIHATLGTIEVRIDGLTVLNLTAQNTRNTATGSTGLINSILFNNTSAAGSVSVNIDDMYILNEQGSTPFNDFLGDVTIAYLQPNGIGTNSAWTPSAGVNWDTVADPLATAPAITDFVSSSTTDQKDTYAVENLTQISPSTVLGVVNYAYADKSDTGSRTAALVTKLAANETQSSDLLLRDSTNGGPQYLKQIVPIKPGGGSWTIDDVNAMEIGVVCRP